ncbi:MAG TPA: serine hydrolase domain-containing protein [Blastocatellia bacterium]|nr:serine hydrolase domain-containing protein [Blastocatellia bacterium]
MKNSVIICLLAAFLAVMVSAQTAKDVKLPETPAGKTFAAFLVALNSGDIEVMRRFHSERSGDLDNAQQDLDFYKQSGGLKLHSVIQSSEHEIEALVQTKSDGRWLNFKMLVDSAPPHPAVKIGVHPVDAPAGAATTEAPRNDAVKPATQPQPGAAPAAKKMTEAEMVSSLESYLDELAKQDKFSGVVLVAKDGKPVFEKAYGLANKSKNIPINKETKFNLGSMNKMFTSVAIAQLVEAGKLSFDDTVGKHLPDYPNKDVAGKVTIHQLLTHTSGLGSYWNAKFDAKKSGIKTVSDYLSLFADEPLLFEPGQRFEYSNSGFIVLGAIIEKVSGQSYYDYVREHIYKPAGMKNTDAYEMTEQTPNMAMGYTIEGKGGAADGARRENISSRPNKGGPAGGGYSTVEDLLKFHVALRDHKLLSPKYTDLITTGKVAAGGGKYGYGFGERVVNGRRVFGHNGGAPGIASDLSMFPELGYTSVVMTNYDPPLMMPVVRKIVEMITLSKDGAATAIK